MRRSKEATAESRRLIVDTASRLFMTRGVEGVGVADIMQAAGMTHGGFYRHFASKEALLQEATSHAFSNATSRLGTRQDELSPNVITEKLRSYVGDYLSRGHVTHVEEGCPMAAMGTEVPHAGEGVTGVFADGVEAIVSRLSRGLGDLSPTPRDAALRLLSNLVGTIVVARAVGVGTLQDDIIEAMRSDPLVLQILDRPAQ